MSINVNATSSYSSLAQLLQSNNQTETTQQTQGSMPPPPPPPADGDSKMASDISDVLAELGISVEDSSSDDETSETSSSTTTSTESSSSTSASSEALAAFMQSLMDTLHAQGASSTSQSESDADGYSSDSNPMKTDLNSLISQLTSSSSDDEESDSSSAVSLGDFLSAFASKVPDGGQARVGSLVDTTA